MKREERPEKKEEENWEKGLPAPAAFGTLPWGAPLVRPGGRRFGLLGAKLGHSYSPQLHRQLGDYDYRLYEKPREELADFLSQPDLGGLNVTIPYKQEVLSYCDELSPAAKAIGCVNTLVFGERDGRPWLYGHNTDYDGFVYLARRTKIDFAKRKVLILGSGGTSLTAAYAARRLGAAQVVRISRGGPDNYNNLEKHRDAEILVNTTPVGMYPQNQGQLVRPRDFPKLKGVLDVIYNPLCTNLVLEARDLGILASGGLGMLAAQAAAAARLFGGPAISQARLEEILAGLRAQVENIVLIGMPGCGKSRIGRALARLTGRPLFDTDEMVRKTAGREIPLIFQEEGEAGFRAREREAIALAAQKTNAVIATGGGAVLGEANRRALAQNGRLCCLQRELSLLPTKGRPLSVDLQEMYKRRLPIYLQAADLVIENTGSPQEVAAAVLAAYRQGPPEAGIPGL